MKRVILFLVSALVCGTMMTGCGEEDNSVALTGLTVSPESVKKPVGEIQKVTVTAVPADATDVVYTWTSANEDVATVNAEGIVRIIGVGTTTVTVTSGALSKTVQVEGTIKSIALKDDTGGSSGMYPYNGTNMTFTITATTDPVADVAIVWSSNADNVTVVANENSMSATVTVSGTGAAIVTATAGDIKAEYNIETTSVFESAAGYWTFEDAANLGHATVGEDLTVSGEFDVIQGPSATKKAILKKGLPDGFSWQNSFQEDSLTNFTVLIDAWAPLDPDRRYYTIWWNGRAHNNSFSIRSRDKKMTLNRAGATLGEYTDVIEPGQEPWARIVISYAVDPNDSDKRILNTYADGRRLEVDGIGNRTPEMDLYKDRLTWFLTGNPEGNATGDHNPYKVSTIAVWNRTLTPEEVAALGGVSK